jgi:hypothetical protein
MLINYSHHASDEISCNACLRMLEWGVEEEKTFGVHCKQELWTRLSRTTGTREQTYALTAACYWSGGNWQR